jgi:predicted transcriptional regulator
MATKMTLSIKLDPEVKKQLEDIAKQQNTSLNRLVLRYISQGIQADTGVPDRLAAIEARLDAIEAHLNLKSQI